MTRSSLVIPLLAAALLAGGCGGDQTAERRQGEDKAGGRKDRPTPSGRDDASKREFETRADRLCAQLDKKGERLQRMPPRSADQLVGFARRFLRFFRDAQSQFARLPLPSEPRARAGAERFLRSVRRFGEPLGRLQRSSRALERAADRKDEEAAEEAVLELNAALLDIRRLEIRANRIARSYGLEECAEEDDEPEAPGRQGPAPA